MKLKQIIRTFHSWLRFFQSDDIAWLMSGWWRFYRCSGFQISENVKLKAINQDEALLRFFVIYHRFEFLTVLIYLDHHKTIGRLEMKRKKKILFWFLFRGTFSHTIWTNNVVMLLISLEFDPKQSIKKCSIFQHINLLSTIISKP